MKKIKTYPLEEPSKGIYVIRVEIPQFKKDMKARLIPFRDGDKVYADIFIESIKR